MRRNAPCRILFAVFFQARKLIASLLGAYAHRRAVSLCYLFGKSPWEGAAAVSVSRGEPREGEIAIPLSGVSFRITFLHEQKSDGALPPLGEGGEGGGNVMPDGLFAPLRPAL